MSRDFITKVMNLGENGNFVNMFLIEVFKKEDASLHTLFNHPNSRNILMKWRRRKIEYNL